MRGSEGALSTGVFRAPRKEARYVRRGGLFLSNIKEGSRRPSLYKSRTDRLTGRLKAE